MLHKARSERGRGALAETQAFVGDRCRERGRILRTLRRISHISIVALAEQLVPHVLRSLSHAHARVCSHAYLPVLSPYDAAVWQHATPADDAARYLGVLCDPRLPDDADAAAEGRSEQRQGAQERQAVQNRAVSFVDELWTVQLRQSLPIRAR
jgi:hypothetical protein